MAKTDPTFNAGRVSVRPLDYVSDGGAVYGHYRAITHSGAVNSISAAGILASLWWADSSRKLVLNRLAVNLTVLTSITTAPVFDAEAFVFRGATAASSGSGSSTLSLSSDKQKLYKGMSSSLLSAAGEVRTLGTTTALTAAASKTNDSAPFGYVTFGSLFNSSSTGTAVKVSVGGAFAPGGWQDLYSINSPYQHPLVLSLNEGIEIQAKTANNTDGTVRYSFLWDWTELENFQE